MALPVAKLALMGLKIVTKPIANQVKSQAKQHPAFKEMCISLGRTINSMTVWANNKMLSRTPAEGTKRFVLNEQQAIERGADAVGELATFFLIGIPVVGIYWSEAEEKNRAKEEARIAKEEFESAINERFATIENEVASIRTDIQALTSELSEWRNLQEALQRRPKNRTTGGIEPCSPNQKNAHRWWNPWGIFG